MKIFISVTLMYSEICDVLFDLRYVALQNIMQVVVFFLELTIFILKLRSVIPFKEYEHYSFAIAVNKCELNLQTSKVLRYVKTMSTRSN